MRGLAEKALGLYGEEDGEGGNPFGKSSKGEDYGADLEEEMTAFLEAAAKKDVTGMAEAFKEASRLCAK